MRFMVMVKASPESEAGEMPSRERLEEMGRFNQQLIDAGMLLAAEGLHPTSKAAKVRFSGKKRTVIDGPFPETKELVAGFWILKAASREDVIEWIKRCPNPMTSDSDIEIRQIFEPEEFGGELTDEIKARREKVRQQVAKN